MQGDMSGHCAVIQVRPLCNGMLDLAGGGGWREKGLYSRSMLEEG